MTGLEEQISWLALKWLGIWSIIAVVTWLLVFLIFFPGDKPDEPRRGED